jgi:hypothetical protein
MRSTGYRYQPGNRDGEGGPDDLCRSIANLEWIHRESNERIRPRGRDQDDPQKH